MLTTIGSADIRIELRMYDADPLPGILVVGIDDFTAAIKTVGGHVVASVCLARRDIDG
ncbi:uncharacterized protein METZ01_LOCUS7484 [marine metagenome]|uniref:Uncharacterized protein n=1 Tax=marine metagenome TaxID=408172 RepID=A0A381NJA0_9ZZZZ